MTDNAAHIGFTAAVITAAACSPARAEVSFQLPGFFPILKGKHIAADLDADGDLDLIGGDGTAVKLNDGSGLFTVGFTFSGGDDFALGDLDHDGALDVLLASPGSGVSLAIHYGTGSGTFGPPTPIEEPNPGDFAGWLEVAFGDVDLDGWLDAVLTEDDGDDEPLTVLLGDGAGGLSNQPLKTALPIGPRKETLAVLPMGPAALPGAVMAFPPNPEDQQLLAYLSNGDGSFTPSNSPILASIDFTRVVDVDFDPELELVAASSGKNASDHILILEATDSGVAVVEDIALQADFPGVNFSGLRVDVADFNLDGLPDIAVPLNVLFQFVIYEQQPEGGFVAGQPFRTIANPNRVLAGDFNSDGKPDLIVFGPGGGAVYLNGTTSPPVIDCEADTNGDGVVNSADLNRVLGEFGAICNE